MVRMKIAMTALLFVCLISVPPPSWSYQTHIEIIPPGWIEAEARDINNARMVAGSGKDDKKNERGFLYRMGRYKTLIPPGWRRSYAYGINRDGAVVGYGLDDVHKGFVYVDGNYTAISPPGWREAFAFAINDKGSVVGYGRKGRFYTGFMYSNRTYTEILPPDWQEAYVYGINNSDVIVGYGRDKNGTSRGFMYSNGQYTPILPPGWLEAKAVDINDSGDVTGFGFTRASIPTCFIYRGGSYSEITIPRIHFAEVGGINRRGAVAGKIKYAGRNMQGFFYDGLKIIPLLPSGWLWSQAHAVNDRGDVVGFGSYGGEKRGFLTMGTPAISVNPTVLFFGGNVHTWLLDDKTVTVKNKGDGELIIESVTDPAFPFAIASDKCSGQRLSPTETCEISYRVSKTSERAVHASAGIQSNDPGKSSVELTFGIFPDSDSDGYTVDIDCDDSDPSVNPGMKEALHNKKDDDCNPATPDSGTGPQ